MTSAEAQRVFGVSEGSIRNRRNRFAAGGVAGLESGRVGRRAGDGAKLTQSQADALAHALVVFSPERLELGGLLWTLRKVAELTKRLFGVSFTEQGMGKVRAIEANPEAMAEWVQPCCAAWVWRSSVRTAVDSTQPDTQGCCASESHM